MVETEKMTPKKAMEYGTSIDPNTFSTENVKGGA